MSITRELWISNLLESASTFADKEAQERRWLASDRYAWECPEELINDLYDGYNFELFIEEFDNTFTKTQRAAILLWKKQIDELCNATPGWFDEKQLLADPRWESIRESARAFIAAFQDKWPPQ